MIISYKFFKSHSEQEISREPKRSNSLIATFVTRGNAELLSQNKLAVFASNATQNLMNPEIPVFFNELRNTPIALAGGWQSFIEKILFNTTELTDRANYLYYLARDLNSYCCNSHQQKLLKANKLLVISRPCIPKRISRRSTSWRNHLIFMQMQRILFLYIRPEGQLHSCYEYLLKNQHRIYILDIPENHRFFCDGVVPVNRLNIRELLTL